MLLFCSASGVARGSGWQKFGAYVNLGAYYLVGTPVAAVLAFVLHLRAKSLLIGLATRSCVQASLLALRTIFTNWQEYGFNPNNFLLQFDLLLRWIRMSSMWKFIATVHSSGLNQRTVIPVWIPCHFFFSFVKHLYAWQPKPALTSGLNFPWILQASKSREDIWGKLTQWISHSTRFCYLQSY